MAGGATAVTGTVEICPLALGLILHVFLKHIVIDSGSENNPWNSAPIAEDPSTSSQLSFESDSAGDIKSQAISDSESAVAPEESILESV